MTSRPNSSAGRRRRSVVPSTGTVVTAAVIAYGTYRFASWAWNAWKDDEEEEAHGTINEQGSIGGLLRGLFERPREYGPRRQSQQQQERQHWKLRRQRVERCREETSKALADFLPTLRRSIEEQTDTTSETRALKQLRAEKRQLNGDTGLNEQHRLEQEREMWDTIKVQAMTRMMATAYAHTTLFLVLTVQVHLLGGRLFELQTSEDLSRKGGGGTSTSSVGNISHSSNASDLMGSYQSSHRQVLSRTYEYFFGPGISSLVRTVERAVADVMAEWDVMDSSSMNISCEDMDDAVSQIRDIVEGRKLQHRARNRSRQSPRMRQRSILRFLLPPEQGLDDTVTDELARSILDETWDLMESPVLEDAQRDGLHVTFDVMRDQHWSKIFMDSNGCASPPHITSQTGTRPLATVITQLRHTSSSFYEKVPKAGTAELHLMPLQEEPNIYCPALERIPSILELGDVSFN